MAQRQLFLKGGAGSFQGLSFLHLEITLPFAKLCYAFEEKLIFFCHHNFMKKGNSRLSKKWTWKINITYL